MSPKLFRVILPVTDIDSAARFYASVLDLTGQRVSPGRHYFDCGGTILACFDPQADGDGYVAKPLSEWLYFGVDDVEAVYQRCQEHGGKLDDSIIGGDPAGEIVTRPWGERSFYAHDPFGNKLCFVDRSTCFTGP